MRLAVIQGTVTTTRREANLPVGGRLLLAAVLDSTNLFKLAQGEDCHFGSQGSLVVFDQMGAGIGQLIAISEGAEATMPFKPGNAAIDAYSAAIIDELEYEPAKV